MLRATTACTFSTSQLPKVLRTPQFLTHFTSKCASRHNAVHFFDISTSKSAPRPSVFNTFYFHVLRATTPCTFSTSQLPKLLRTPQFLTHVTSKCASRHNAVRFFNISTSKSGPILKCFVPFHFEIGFAPQRRATFHLSSQSDVSAPAALASLLFNPPEPQNHEKTVFRDFPTFSRTCIFFLLTFSLLTLLPADCFFISPYCRKFDF